MGLRGPGAAIVAAVALAGCGGSAQRAPATVPAPRDATTLRIGAPERTIPSGFLGLSVEFQAIRAYTGSDPHDVNPLFVALVRGLDPGQRPVLRIGGDSTDVSWVPAAGVTPSRFAGYRYPLTPSWFQTTAALAHELDARLILGLNLAAGEPALAAAEARADVRAFGAGSIDAFEIGNEPNLYATINIFKLADGRSVTARARGYGPPQYERELGATVAAVRAAVSASGGNATFAGPAFAASEQFGTGDWQRAMASLLRGEPALRTLTVHRYPLKQCFVSPGPQIPTLAHLLSPYATAGLAAGVRPWVALAHAQGRGLRIDELNTVACRGEPGVSDTFASALWATDALFSLAAVGVDGVNVHTLPDAAYEPFTFTERAGHWTAHVLPEYYGLELFAQAAPAGARLLSVRGAAHSVSLSAWATRAPGGTVRLVLIDKDPGHARVVRVPVPAGTGTGTGAGAVSIERLSAPSVAATAGVSLGGRSFAAATSHGTPPAPKTTVAPRTRGGDVVVRVPGGSAALLTFPASG